ncbi:MAG: hypothetical protein Q4G71_09475 [Pseudomonadota bacterium]|nr:hypothetical protein [Pseudomonadota bacterium]
MPEIVAATIVWFVLIFMVLVLLCILTLPLHLWLLCQTMSASEEPTPACPSCARSSQGGHTSDKTCCCCGRPIRKKKRRRA